MDDRHRELQALAHAERQAFRPRIGGLDETETLEHFIHARRRLRLGGNSNNCACSVRFCRTVSSP